MIINPHYRIKVLEDVNGEVTVQLITTHHEVELRANRMKDELERAIWVLRDDPRFRRGWTDPCSSGPPSNCAGAMAWAAPLRQLQGKLATEIVKVAKHFSQIQVNLLCRGRCLAISTSTDYPEVPTYPKLTLI